jgi:branched-chain amino acid transport system substrate-binding protein
VSTLSAKPIPKGQLFRAFFVTIFTRVSGTRVSGLLVSGMLVFGLLVSGCAVQNGATSLATGSVPPATAATATATATGPSAASSARLPAANERVAKVGLLLPLSAPGQTAIIAKAMKQAAEMALFDAGSNQFQLIVKDDLGTPEGAANAAEEALKEGAELIVGPLFAASVKSIAPVALRANVPVIAFSNDTQVAGRGVYLVSFIVTQDIDRIVAYAVSKGRRRFAALIADDAYGRLMGDAFQRAVTANSGTVKAMETYPATQANAMLDPARKLVEAIKRADEDGETVDAVFVPGSPETLASLGPLLTYAGLDTSRFKLIGTGAWDHPNLSREAAFQGGWFAGPEPRGWQDFSERFGRTFGTSPPRIATLAYDAITVAVQLSSNPAGARYTPATLTRMTGFNGTDGPLRLRADGTADRGLAVLEVQKLGLNVLEPAPAGFGGAKISSAGVQPVN